MTAAPFTGPTRVCESIRAIRRSGSWPGDEKVYDTRSQRRKSRRRRTSMRKFINITTILILSLTMATAATAQMRGRGRLQGVVLDKATGKPIGGATVTLVLSGEQTQPITTKTDSKGRWSALGLTSGGWNIDIAANGYDTSRGSASVSEMQMVPMIKTELTPAARQEPTPMAAAPTPLIPKEAVDAIREGQ